jgi:ABC-type branched-subunit amino acid transport system ATPase component/ABC-type branched-subunit amino acid transport system permease subunit
MTDTSAPVPQIRAATPGLAATIGAVLPFLVLLVAGISLPLFGGGYWGVIATRACVYWVLVSGLNLVVGFAGQIAIGWVALLTLGAYTTSVLAAGTVTPALSPYLALAIAAAVGAVFGVIIGLPALRLRTFYFAMTTLGFATIITQVALAWQSVTGGGVGVAGPIFAGPFSSQWGLYYFCFGLAAICTWMTANIAASRFGRALTAIRDAEVAAEATGISKSALLVAVFLFSGAVAGVAGGLFASLQSYITPDAFTFDLSVLFFIAILIGGRGSILGPLIGTIILTVLPEFAAPLVAWSTFLYAALLLVIVLAVPGGIAELIDFKNRRPLESNREIVPRPALLPRVLGENIGGENIGGENIGGENIGAENPRAGTLSLEGVVLSFGGVRAINGLDLEIRPGQVHGLIGPNGSGKTTTLNVISGYYAAQEGHARLNGTELPSRAPHMRASRRIARTFQTPRVIGAASVLQNVMIGGTIDGSGTFVESMLALPRHRRDEARLRERAMLALAAVGLDPLAPVRADRLQHSELRFMEIARALMLRPAFLLLDEPAAGLSAEEIRRLGAMIVAISRQGTGVLLVEHHADLIFDICDHVTVLNLGQVLAAGTPAEIRSHREVVNAYLGA